MRAQRCQETALSSLDPRTAIFRSFTSADGKLLDFSVMIGLTDAVDGWTFSLDWPSTDVFDRDPCSGLHLKCSKAVHGSGNFSRIGSP